MRVFRTLFVFVLAFVVFTPTSNAQFTSRTESDSEMHWAHSDDGHSFDVRTKGKVIFLDDDSGVKSISEGGFLKISVEEDGRHIELEVYAAAGGSLRYEYKLNHRRVEYSESVQKSLEDLFLYIIRETGIDVEDRVARILKEDGPSGVFEEIDAIESGSSVRRYLTQLVIQGELGSRNLNRAANVAGDRIFSSGDLARFLRTTLTYYLEEKDARSAFFELTGSIGSPGDRARVLMKVLELAPDDDAYSRLIAIAVTIESSGDKTRVLMAGLGVFPENDKVRKMYFDAVKTIGSSGDRSRLLRALLSEYEIDASTAGLAFDAAQSISGSGDKARVLMAAAANYTGSAEHRELFFKAVATISSSGDHARVLLSLLSEGNPGAETITEILRSTQRISSGGDAARVLISASEYVDDPQVEAYLRAARQVSSAGDRSRVLKALMDQ